MNLEQKQEELIAQMGITRLLRILPYNKDLSLDKLQKKAQIYLDKHSDFTEQTIEDITHQNIPVMSKYSRTLRRTDTFTSYAQKKHNIPSNRLIKIAAMTGTMCIIPAYYLLTNLF